MKETQQKIIDFIEDDEEIEEKLQNLRFFIDDLEIKKNIHKFRSFLYLVANISNNYHRSKDFFSKIAKIILILKNLITQKLTNSEIFNIFENNKRIILFLYEEKIIEIDEYIAKLIISKKFYEKKYSYYFFKEIKPFLDNSMIRKHLKYDFLTDDFDEKRKEGENENYLPTIIRNDSIEDFIIFVNQNNYPLNSVIPISIYETNSFLIGKTPTLIEYSAFFGSVQIFTYLYKNKVKMKLSLWIYAIHGNNPEMIHLLVNILKLDDKNYICCLKEAIKCHYNEMTNYILNNLLTQKVENENLGHHLNSTIFHYYNFAFFPESFTDKYIFFYACQYDHFFIVEFLLETKKIELNLTVISTQILYLMKFQIKKNSYNFLI